MPSEDGVGIWKPKDDDTPPVPTSIRIAVNHGADEDLIAMGSIDIVDLKALVRWLDDTAGEQKYKIPALSFAFIYKPFTMLYIELFLACVMLNVDCDHVTMQDFPSVILPPREDEEELEGEERKHPAIDTAFQVNLLSLCAWDN